MCLKILLSKRKSLILDQFTAVVVEMGCIFSIPYLFCLLKDRIILIFLTQNI